MKPYRWSKIEKGHYELIHDGEIVGYVIDWPTMRGRPDRWGWWIDEDMLGVIDPEGRYLNDGSARTWREAKAALIGLFELLTTFEKVTNEQAQMILLDQSLAPIDRAVQATVWLESRVRLEMSLLL